MLFISILTLITAKAVKLININHIQFTRLSYLILLYAGALNFNVLYFQSIGTGIGIYNGYFHITQITQSIEILLYIIGGIILLSWPKITNYQTGSLSSLDEELKPSQTAGQKIINNILEYKGDNYSTNYSIIILFSIFGSSLLISSFDLISIYLSIELQSFGLYILATLYRNSESSTSAGLKYFLLGALSSCIILLGSGLIYAYTGITNLESLYLLNSISNITNPDIIININNTSYSLQGINLGIILIFIGFLFKIAAAPLHNWSPDVYDEVPTIVTTWLTIIPKIAILFLLLELQNNLFGGSIINYLSLPTFYEYSLFGKDFTVLKNILLISSLLSLIIGSILGLAQIKIKRLLAYSTISHIGFILLALSINTEQSIDSFIFYIIQYTITNLNIFLILLALSYKLNNVFNTKDNNETNKDINYISQFNSLFFNNPLLCISLAISLFSMAGIPPLIGFFSKQFVLYSALQNGYYFISLIAILVSVISASYYLQIIKNMYNYLPDSNSLSSLPVFNRSLLHLKADTQEVKSKNQYNLELNINTPLTNIHSFMISILNLIIIFFFIKPNLLLNGTQLLALSLFYN